MIQALWWWLVVQAVVLVVAVAFVVVNLLVDLVYGALDPRFGALADDPWHRRRRRDDHG